MTRAVLDSSVLYSAFLKPTSVPSTLLGLARQGAFELYLSIYILEETATALLRPKARRRTFRPGEVAEFCDGLVAAAVLVTDLPELHVVPNDPNDDPVVAPAVASSADILVTGDRRHLLSLHEYQGIRIISPRDFLDQVSGRG